MNWWCSAGGKGECPACTMFAGRVEENGVNREKNVRRFTFIYSSRDAFIHQTRTARTLCGTEPRQPHTLLLAGNNSLLIIDIKLFHSRCVVIFTAFIQQPQLNTQRRKRRRRSAAVRTQLAEGYVHLKLASDSLRLCARRRRLQSLSANEFIVRLNRVRLSFNLSKWIKEIQLIPNVNMLRTWRIVTHSAGVCARPSWKTPIGIVFSCSKYNRTNQRSFNCDQSRKRLLQNANIKPEKKTTQGNCSWK